MGVILIGQKTAGIAFGMMASGRVSWDCFPIATRKLIIQSGRRRSNLILSHSQMANDRFSGHAILDLF